jgi:hypothetical protein
MRLALTEENPLIRPYDEKLWAELPDSKAAPIESSLELLDRLHLRWRVFLDALSPKDYERRYRHPEYAREYTLDEGLALYAWHGRHHVAHITALRQRRGW